MGRRGDAAGRYRVVLACSKAPHLLHLPPAPSIEPLHPLAHVDPLPSSRRRLTRHVAQAARDPASKVATEASVHDQRVDHARGELTKAQQLTQRAAGGDGGDETRCDGLVVRQ